MSMTKIKAGLLSAALVAGVGTPIVIQHQSVSRLRAENVELREQSRRLEPLREANQPFAALRADADELERLRNEVAEIHRLRAQVARLRREQEDAALLQAENARLKEHLKTLAAQPAHTGAASADSYRLQVLPLIQFEDVPLHDAIHTLARQACLNLHFDPKVAPHLASLDGSLKLTIRLENLTAEEALRTILSTNGLRLVNTPGTGWTRSRDVGQWSGDVVGVTTE